MTPLEIREIVPNNKKAIVKGKGKESIEDEESSVLLIQYWLVILFVLLLSKDREELHLEQYVLLIQLTHPKEHCLQVEVLYESVSV